MGNKIGRSRTAKHGLICGKLPPGCSYIQKQLSKYRLALEDAVLHARGSIGPVEMGVIQTCVRHELVAQLAGRWLRRATVEELAAEKAIDIAARAANASAARDKCLLALGLLGKRNPELDLPDIDDECDEDPAPSPQ